MHAATLPAARCQVSRLRRVTCRALWPLERLFAASTFIVLSIRERLDPDNWRTK